MTLGVIRRPLIQGLRPHLLLPGGKGTSFIPHPDESPTLRRSSPSGPLSRGVSNVRGSGARADGLRDREPGGSKQPGTARNRKRGRVSV